MNPFFTELLLRAGGAVAMISAVLGMANLSVLLERKGSAWIQGRVGPNRTNIPFVAAIPLMGPMLGRLGLIQSAADGGKLLLKEDPVPGHVNKPYYFLAPLCALAPALIVLVMTPFGRLPNGSPLALCDADTGFLFMFAISSLGVYGITLGGWAANSKYPFLGAIRASAQLISYELAMGLSVVPIVMAVAAPGFEGSPLSLSNIVLHQAGGGDGATGFWHILTHPLSAFIFLVAVFAETNRAPFDMAESETDLVGGFHTEYGSFKFGLFFVGEYGHMIVGSSLFILMFLGGWSLSPVADAELMAKLGLTGTLGLTLLGVGIFFAKLVAMLFFFVWVRWTLPRFRYDQVMNIGWNKLLPLAIANLIAYLLIYAI